MSKIVGRPRHNIQVICHCSLRVLPRKKEGEKKKRREKKTQMGSFLLALAPLPSFSALPQHEQCGASYRACCFLRSIIWVFGIRRLARAPLVPLPIGPKYPSAYLSEIAAPHAGITAELVRSTGVGPCIPSIHTEYSYTP